MPEVPAQTSPQETTPVAKPHNWKKVSLVTLFIIICVAIVVGIYWFMVVNKSSTDPNLTVPVPKVTTQTATESAHEATPSVEKDETADWNIFNDGEFKIKYPQDWVIEDVSPSKEFHQIHAKTVDEKIIVMFATNFQGGPDFGPDSKLITKHTILVNGKSFEASERVRNDDGRWYLVGGGQELYFEGFSKTTPTDKELDLIKAVLQNFELI